MFKKLTLTLGIPLFITAGSVLAAAPTSGLHLVNNTPKAITVTCNGKPGWLPIPANGAFMPTLPWRTLHDMFGANHLTCSFTFSNGAKFGNTVIDLSGSYTKGTIMKPTNVDESKYSINATPNNWGTALKGLEVTLNKK